MRSIGIRELRQQVSRYPSPADALLESGQLPSASGDLLDLGAPLEPRRGVRLPSAELAAIRKDER